MKTIALDFETYYSAAYSIGETGLFNYVRHPEFDPYMISLYGDGVSYVGRPEDFDWSSIIGEPFVFVSHHRNFDETVWDEAKARGIIPTTVKPADWFCSMELCSFIGAPRGLKNAARIRLGLEMSKEVRDSMKGKKLSDVEDDALTALLDYALLDAKACYDLWVKHEKEWPAHERAVARLTYTQMKRGFAIDLPMLEAKIPGVEAANKAAYAGIPWAGTLDDNGKEVKPTSPKALKKWCETNGEEVPTTTNAKDPRFIRWLEEHPHIEVVGAMQRFRSSNALLKKSKQLLSRSQSGIFNHELKYHWCDTGRFSGGFEDEREDSSSINIQNLPRAEMFGLDLRSAFVPRPGKQFCIADLNAIEPRCSAWLRGDTKMLDLLRAGEDVYQAHAKLTMGYKGNDLKKDDPDMRYLCKVQILSLTYGTGWFKFMNSAIAEGASMRIFEAPVTKADVKDFDRYIAFTRQEEQFLTLTTPEKLIWGINAWKIVQQFRAENSDLCGKQGWWKKFEDDCKRCVNGDYKIELPSGRFLRYFGVQTTGGLTVLKRENEKRERIWGSFFYENVCQAMARDVLCHSMMNVEEAGYDTLANVHDEVIAEADLGDTCDRALAAMIKPPEWASDLPLKSSLVLANCYEK